MKKSGSSPKIKTEQLKATDDSSPAKAHDSNYFESLAQNIPLGIAVVNKDQKLEYLNPKFTEMFGYTLKDLPDIQTWYEKAYPDKVVRERMNLSWKQELLRGAVPGSVKQEASTISRPDGAEISVHLRITRMEESRRILVYENITDRVRAEVLMLDGWNIYRNLVETVLDWTWEIKKNGVFTYSSPQVTNILGYMPGDVVGKSFFDFLSAKGRKKIKTHPPGQRKKITYLV